MTNRVQEELMQAVSSGNKKTIRRYVERGANVNTRTNDGHTPVFIAALNGHADIIKILVDLKS
jgi:ankyrin repeat protein